ncbi:hypothetical protein GGI05_007106, partial [Coemansia sp. RSA 2603]
MALGRLIHIGVDLVLVSTALAGIRQATGLKFKPESLTDSKSLQSYINTYLSIGEKTVNLAVYQ